jgi:cell division initiation protein
MAAATTDGAPGGRSRKFFGQVTFTPSKRGYEQEEVDAFLEQAGSAIERLLQRLREAEALAGDAQGQLESAEERARHAEFQMTAQQGDEGLIQRTLTLAERTAVAAVADAKHRAQEILQQANLEAANVFGLERQRLDAERNVVAAEHRQLESLRLAIAAESHSLEQVRASLRARVAAVADELQQVADSPDGLSYHIAGPAVATAGTDRAEDPMPEVVAAPATPQLEQPAPPAVEPAVVPPSMAPPLPAPSVAVPVEAQPVEAQAAPTPAPEGAQASAELPDPAAPPGWPYVQPPAADPPPEAATAQAAAPADGPAPKSKSFEAAWQQEAATGDPAADQAFAQFFSDKVESDPAQSWILAS